ncbi:DUF2064 domain-containing protein [Marinoscillum sp. MHG1-6]|uniref:DUF2064 domain-containing protein n=1 Tax=Marinoscillum sp. MHG1-6 TaxID=2959627 RepID=UPI002158637D|nr:DUF2064 domain-containing protein [Marinoscillum sp. MHG1-6]
MSFFKGVIQDSDIAILFFSRSAQAESTSKHWFNNKNQDTKFANYLVQRTYRHLKTSGLQVIHLNEHQQVGKTFGERITNAFECVFQKGYRTVICVGNDASAIDQLNWTQITASLKQGNNVIGPDLRKGAYLIALRQEHFNRAQFENLSWQTSGLLAQLSSLGPTAFLNNQKDLNNQQDVLQLKKMRSAIRKFLFRLFGKAETSDIPNILVQVIPIQSLSLRAPPSIY